MIDNLLQNKFVLIGGALLLAAIAYKLFFSKDEASKIVEREYDEILKSDKYKVKGQYD